jgi:hypothetical protein
VGSRVADRGAVHAEVLGGLLPAVAHADVVTMLVTDAERVPECGGVRFGVVGDVVDEGGGGQQQRQVDASGGVDVGGHAVS